MSWNQGGGGGPWGSGGGPGPWGSGGGGRNFQPPNFEEALRRLQALLRQILPGGGRAGGSSPRLWALGFAVVLLLWGASGLYRVDPDQEGIVLRFGAFTYRTTPGLHLHLPWPIEEALTPTVTRVNRVEIGYRTALASGTGARDTDVPEESLMLTGDENIVDINFTVFWLVKDAQAYLFNIRNPELTVKSAAESAMREVIGHTEIATAFAEGRGKIETDTQKLLQEILDYYGAGIDVTQVQLLKVDPPNPVIDAFRDVQSAKIDLQTLVNQSESYRNDVVPRAHGDASRIDQEAQAYRAQIVLQAQGDAARFQSVYDAYKISQDVTARRLYIETMESILKSTSKVLIDKSASNSGVVPYLPLPGLVPRTPAAAAAPGPAPTPATAPSPATAPLRGVTP
jgi:modulator of FtsH protease HflK